ncbi:TPA: site-specific integrase [Vibrio harveyi]|nr:site-specific integrase [Vibrio harveyi]
MTITERALKSKQNFPTDKNHSDLADGGGLLARFYKSGKISFCYRYRWKGKQAILTFGSYPNVSLKEARERHREAKKTLEQGIDPRGDKSKTQIKTVEQCINFWIKEELLPRRKHPTMIVNALNTHIISKVGDHVWEDMKTVDWVHLLKNVNGKVMPVRLLTELKQCAKYLMVVDAIKDNKLIHIQSRFVGEPSKPRERVLSMSELKQIYDYCHREDYSPEYAAVCLILMFTGARSGELRVARKENVNLKDRTWSVPPEESKTTRLIVRPIPDFLIKHFEFLYNLNPSSEYMIISNRGDILKPAGFQCRFKSMQKALKFPSWSPHVFRHTLSTHFGDLKIEPYVAEKMQAHEMAGEMKTYNKGQYLEQQLEAMHVYHEAIRNYK